MCYVTVLCPRRRRKRTVLKKKMANIRMCRYLYVLSSIGQYSQVSVGIHMYVYV